MPERIAVIGQSGPLSPEVAAFSHAVGAGVARRGGLLFSGGRDGVMEAASKGAKENGGLVVGILNGDDPDGGNQYLDVRVTTGLDFAYRSMILIHSADAVIMVGGANGTLGELSTAYLFQKPIVLIPASGGWAQRVPEVAEEGKYLDWRKNVEIHYAQDGEEAVALAYELIARRRGGEQVKELHLG